MSNQALLLIDIQNDYFEGGKWPLFNMSNAASNAAKLLKLARENGMLVVHVRHEFAGADAPFFAPGSEGARIHPKVSPLETENIIVKHQINAFRDTNLKALLDKSNVSEVIICGAMSNVCIDAAARAAADYGYKVTVVHDACAAMDGEFEGEVTPAKQVHVAYMAALKFGYASVISAEEFALAMMPSGGIAQPIGS